MRPDPISLLLLISALVASTGFVGLYATNSPWRLTGVGKAMMTMAVALMGVCISGLLFQLLGPDYPFRFVVRNLVYLALNIALWWQLFNLVRMQNRLNRVPARRVRNEDEDKTPAA